MEEVYANVEYDKPQGSIRPSTPAPGPRSPRSRPHGAVAVSLGLLSVLLLVGLVCLGVHLHASGDKLSSVSAERDQLKDNFTALMDNFTALTQEKERLQLLLKQSKSCPEGWRNFSCSCYLFSTRDDSWTNARTDCTDQGADLVIIDSPQEQKFISDIVKSHTWIGLSDREIEGTWKWVDGTPLTAAHWGAKPDPVQPDDYEGKEDCVEMVVSWNSERNWNDRDCTFPLKWICEKLV